RRRHLIDRGDHERGRPAGAGAPPGDLRGPLARRDQSATHGRAWTGLFHGQGAVRAALLRGGRKERTLGGGGVLPRRQRRADPVGAPEGRGLAAPDRAHAGRPLPPERCLPAVMTVDVRDTALAHIGLLESVSVANGQRFVAASGDKRNVELICADIGRLLPELGFAGAELVDPFPERIQAREAEMRGVWAVTELRNDRVRAATNLRFRPPD